MNGCETVKRRLISKGAELTEMNSKGHLMRKLLISLLLASAAASPALAAPNDSSDRQQARADRQQARSEARAERQQVREERSSTPDVQHQNLERADRTPRQVEAESRRDTRRDDAAAARSERIEQVQQRFQDRQARIQDRQARIDLRQSDRPLPRVMRNPVPVVSDIPRAGTQPPPRMIARNTPAVQWNTNWRHDNRYDWTHWRRHHHSLFHLGFYYDPFGWGYSQYQIGWRLWPNYYSSRYWINDPWQYRLPYAPAGYRWIRYWDDALLVDTWTGEVVDSIPNFFW
jgi:hypothetical protein